MSQEWKMRWQKFTVRINLKKSLVYNNTRTAVAWSPASLISSKRWPMWFGIRYNCDIMAVSKHNRHKKYSWRQRLNESWQMMLCGYCTCRMTLILVSQRIDMSKLDETMLNLWWFYRFFYAQCVCCNKWGNGWPSLCCQSSASIWLGFANLNIWSLLCTGFVIKKLLC